METFKAIMPDGSTDFIAASTYAQAKVSGHAMGAVEVQFATPDEVNALLRSHSLPSNEE